MIDFDFFQAAAGRLGITMTSVAGPSRPLDGDTAKIQSHTCTLTCDGVTMQLDYQVLTSAKHGNTPPTVGAVLRFLMSHAYQIENAEGNLTAWAQENDRDPDEEEVAAEFAEFCSLTAQSRRLVGNSGFTDLLDCYETSLELE